MKDPLIPNTIIALERISEVFKTLLWEKAKVHGISPIQIKLLLFISGHAPELCNVSHLANEFNVTKPTISDAVKVLNKKGYLDKEYSETDSRRYTLALTETGNKLEQELDTYAHPLQTNLQRLPKAEVKALYTTLTQLIFQLNRSGILTVQRTCFACKFYNQTQSGHYCNLLQQPLVDHEIRLDCPEFESKSA